MRITETAVLRQRPSKIKPIKSKQLDCRFIGSFFSLDNLPQDILPQIAFAGRSNVGKSSLLNKLVGRRKVAKVSSTPGKTRSINFFKINERFYFVDLPGYGYAKVSKKIRESWGGLIEGCLTQNRQLVGLVLLLDCRREITEEDLQLVEWLAQRKLPVVIALTKSDKLNRDRLNRKVQQTQQLLGRDVMPFSIVSGVGKKELLRAIFDLIDEYYRSKKIKSG